MGGCLIIILVSIATKVPHLRIHENHIKAGIMRKLALPQNMIEFDNLICRR